MFSKSFKFSALLLTLGLMLGLAVAGCSDSERDNGNNDPVTETKMKVDFSQITIFDRDMLSKVDTERFAVEFFMDVLDLDNETVDPEFVDITEKIDGNGIYDAGTVTIGETYGIIARFTDKETGDVVGIARTSAKVERDVECVVTLKDEDIATAKISLDFANILGTAGNIVDTVVINDEEYRVADMPEDKVITVGGIILVPGEYSFNIKLCANEVNEEVANRVIPDLSGILAVASNCVVTVEDVTTDVTRVLEVADFDTDMDVVISFDEEATAKLDILGVPASVKIDGEPYELVKGDDGLYSARVAEESMGVLLDWSELYVLDSEGNDIAGLSLGSVHVQPTEESTDEMVVTVTADQVIEPN